jgi:type IV pilus secretin PilQ/predicted competence protein
LSASENVTLDFKEADMQNVLKIISYKSGVNIVTTPDVIGNVTIRLVDVPWERALDVVLKTYGFGYQRQGNVILVTKLDNISKIQAEEPLQTEIFTLKFLDAQDAQKILIPLLSPRGKISILYTRGQKGWQFGTFKIGRETTGTALAKEQAELPKAETVSIEKTAGGELVSRKAEFESSIKSKVLIITDTVASLDRIRNVIIPQIDRKPKQVLIETRLMEVNEDKLRDIGFDWGVGSTSNATTSTVTTGAISKDGLGLAKEKLGGHVLGSEFKPSVFAAKEGSTAVPGVEPYNLGAEIVFQKLTGFKFEAILHALEEDVDTNTLSSPRILTLDNQEASILVGYHTPILASTVTAGTASTGTGATVTQTLDYYQEIGIRLNVVPQVNDEGYINMIIHPSVTSSTTSVDATSVASGVTTTTSYPVINVRETQTQVLIRDGETIVIGGLLKDVIGKETIGIPFLSKIPVLGGLFRRDTYDTEKIDLLIFITARIIKEGEFTPEEIARLEKGITSSAKNNKKAKPKKKTK